MVIAAVKKVSKTKIVHLLSLQYAGYDYVRYPDTLVMGLSKIGGLIALFKFSLILKILHKRQFEQELSQSQGKYEDIETFASESRKLESFATDREAANGINHSLG